MTPTSAAYRRSKKQALAQPALAHADNSLRQAVQDGGPFAEVAHRRLLNREVMRVQPPFSNRSPKQSSVRRFSSAFSSK
jgi:hypothetical protein